MPICRLLKGKSPVVRWVMISSVVLLALLLLVAVAVLVINLSVVGATGDLILDSPDNIPDKRYDCVLILGAGLQSDGSPSHMLEDRIKTGVAVFEAVDADCILMSGDRSGDHYDEPAAMKAYAEAMGVPEDMILLDNNGFSTFESIERAREIYGFDNIIVITQEYHLYRALYISEKQGI